MELFKIVYCYDEGGIYVGEDKAILSPLHAKIGQEVYLLPPFSTNVAPPETPQGKRAVWVNGAWSLQDIPKKYDEVTTTARIIKIHLTRALQENFPGELLFVEISGGAEESSESKTIKVNFDTVVDAAKQSAVESLITAHLYSDEKMVVIRGERDAKLAQADWLVLRHIEQKELVANQLLGSTSLTEEKYREWLQYKQLLRDFPAIVVDVTNVPAWPTEPA